MSVVRPTAWVIRFAIIISALWVGWQFGRRYQVVDDSAASECPSKLPRHPVTLVTSLVKFDDNIKHKWDDYARWVPNFIGRLKGAPVVIFYHRNTIDFLQSLLNRTEAEGQVVQLIEVADVWALPWLNRTVPTTNPDVNGTVAKFTSWRDAYQRHQRPRDKSKWGWNTADLYAIWTVKPSLVAQVALANPFGSEYFFWVDIGSFRQHQHKMRQWPSVATVKQIFQRDPRRIILELINPVPIGLRMNFTESDETLQDEYAAGGFFGGQRAAIMWLSAEFERLHDLYFRRNEFVGIDQVVLNSLFLLNPTRVALLHAYQADKVCGDIWFFFQQFLAEPNEKIAGCRQIDLEYP